MTAIENALQGLRQFATSDETRAMLDRLGKILTEQNKFNIEAVVRISDHLEHEVKYYSLHILPRLQGNLTRKWMSLSVFLRYHFG